MKKLILAVLPGLLLYSACRNNGEKKDEGDKSGKVALAESSRITEVTVETLAPSEFNHEVVSNGKVSGRNRADVYFPGSESVISGVYVKNGGHVRKGDRLASLDTYRMEKDENAAVTALAKAELELQNALIGQGYDPEKPYGIPEEVVRLARLRSGYEEAEAALRHARHEKSMATLTAPFDGVIANVNGKPFNRPDVSKPFCTVIGSGMDVEFKVLEGELAVVSPGDEVMVTPFATGENFKGRVSEINPVVDENGLVSLKASVDGAKGLYDGMNVKVSVRKSLGKQLVVPKSAVVLRTGKQVVFTLSDSGGKAMWNYVHTGLENKDHYTITDGLEEGMKVIVTGNINLAHESPVKIVK